MIISPNAQGKNVTVLYLETLEVSNNYLKK